MSTTAGSNELRPLHERTTAPRTLPLPTVGADLVWRRVTDEDLPLILDLRRSAGALDHPRSLVTLDELVEAFNDKDFDPQQDAVIALDHSGRAVAFGSATTSASRGPVVRVDLDAVVLPERRRQGIGHALLAWQEGRGLQHLVATKSTLPGWLVADAREDVTPATGLLQAHGYEPTRWWLELERDLRLPIAAPSPQPGIRLVPYGGDWAERARSAFNDAFRDHWGTRPATAADWASDDRLEAFRPDLSVLAVAPGASGDERVVGFVLSSSNPDEWPLRGRPFGYVGAVGTRRAWRGRGLARTLLTHVLRGFRAAGHELAVLDVDADSPTGALGLYQRLGFTATDRAMSLVKQF
ncbi:GNAT family N-acetyltransferase [Streptomyces sp. NPDC014734]|uniref:GNAT family N-acetyltransferase n=1 Tax=Streptomyces sp. NPDC014734 TaxID=3364886 RepID=UPI00370026FC